MGFGELDELGGCWCCSPSEIGFFDMEQKGSSSVDLAATKVYQDSLAQ